MVGEGTTRLTRLANLCVILASSPESPLDYLGAQAAFNRDRHEAAD
jgi:hypothetical protein